MNTVFIVNPTAGRGSGQKNIALIEAYVRQNDGAEIKITKAAGEAIKLTQEAVAAGVKKVIAVGGDGTLGECLRGVIGTDVSLGILPSGTGNDFARTLGIPLDTAQFLAQIDSLQAVQVDIGLLGDSPFINVVACGFDAVVGERINKGYRWIKGNPAYMVAIFECLSKYKATEIEVKMGEQNWQGKAMICAVANAKSYGGGLKIAPDAEITDGLFDIVIIEEMSKLDFVKTLPKAYSGGHMSHPKVHHFRSNFVEVVSSTKLPVLLDGDLHGYTPFSAKIEPAKVSFLMPKT